MENLHSAYDKATRFQKLAFDSEMITELLVVENGIDRDDIVTTTTSVSVKRSRHKYDRETINAAIKNIRDTFEVEAICKADMLVFM